MQPPTDLFDPARYAATRRPLLEAETLPPWCYTSLQFCLPRTSAACSLLFPDRKFLFGEHATLVPYLEGPDARYKLPVMLEAVVSI